MRISLGRLRAKAQSGIPVRSKSGIISYSHNQLLEMPLFYDEPIDPSKDMIIIFYASIVDGKMWCPDCRRVEGLVKETFSDAGPVGFVIYVGTSSEWKAPDNKYRQDPWKISNVPTIVKLQKGKEVARLGDDNEIMKDLVTFVQS